MLIKIINKTYLSTRDDLYGYFFTRGNEGIEHKRYMCIMTKYEFLFNFFNLTFDIKI